MGNVLCLIVCCIKILTVNLVTGILLRPERLCFSAHVIFDHCIGSIQNILCRTVVFLQLNDFCIREILLKIENIVDIGSTKLVD